MAESESVQKEIFQPEYFDRFKCDGQKCKAVCCKCGWRIDIDKKTYKKYSHLKPKSAAKEIIRHITKREDSENYVIKLDENLSCPLLSEDNWCKIQRSYGEDFLSLTCATYPRIILDFGDFYERTLTLSCPVVAELILFDEKPIKLEKVELTEKVRKSFQTMGVRRRKLPEDLYDKLILIQETEIFILQERTLTIDQRLLLLGLYVDRINELWADISLFDEIDKVSVIYQNTNFLQEQTAQFSRVITFHSFNYMKIIIGLLETLYGQGNPQSLNDRKFLDSFARTLSLKTDEDGKVKISSLAEKYVSLNDERKNFLQQYSNLLENYLVNELILNVVPFTIENTSLNYSYGIFVTFYKMLEILIFSMVMEGNSSKEDFIEAVVWYAHNVDHSPQYSGKVNEYVRDKFDIVQLMQNMLQV